MRFHSLLLIQSVKLPNHQPIGKLKFLLKPSEIYVFFLSHRWGAERLYIQFKYSRRFFD